jgi:hypothetical protein
MKPALASLLLATILSTPGLSEAQSSLDLLFDNLIRPDPVLRHEAMRQLGQLNDRAAIPALIELIRFDDWLDLSIPPALERLSGQKFGGEWKKWVEWLAQRPDIRPHPGFVAWKSDLYALIDPNFKQYLHAGVKHRVRVEEIAWGGVRKDGIPALTNPKHVTPKQATYLSGDELVLGLSVNGDHRAYPLRIMDWHEMANDVVGGRPITISY